MIEAVVFDIGNVLIEWHPEATYDRFIGQDRREALFKNVDLHAMNLRIDQGAAFVPTVDELAAQHPAFKDDILMWKTHWVEMIAPDIPHSVHLMRQLQKNGIPVYALSNFGRDTFEIAKLKYPFLEEFDLAVISGVEKAVKPDPEIYEILEQRSKHAPDRLLFTDDRADNIAMAAKRGWQTHLFENPAGWAARLMREGLLSEEAATLEMT